MARIRLTHCLYCDNEIADDYKFSNCGRWMCLDAFAYMINKAHEATRKAIRKGWLKDPSHWLCCDCGKPATTYDHRDYNFALKVEPVCQSCNVKRAHGIPSSEARKRAKYGPPPPRANTLSYEEIRAIQIKLTADRKAMIATMPHRQL